MDLDLLPIIHGGAGYDMLQVTSATRNYTITQRLTLNQDGSVTEVMDWVPDTTLPEHVAFETGFESFMLTDRDDGDPLCRP